jgi:7,8-dihydropterin-6-yl-methyl-4-(beta-D-ribofuranosyl)aminobenzene 5'-phosphate synthase
MVMRVEGVEQAELVLLVDNVADQARSADRSVTRQPLFTTRGLVPLVAEHGLCVLVRLKAGGGWRSVLLDAGTSGTAAVHNADALGVDLGLVEAVVISHGHADHTAGLGAVAGRLREATPVVVHPDAFLERVFVLGDGTRLPHPRFDPDMHPRLRFLPSDGPTLLAGGRLVVTGRIPRVTGFERGMPIQHAVRQGRLVEDGLVADDQAVAFLVEGKGPVIVTGCGHAGIVNTVRYALELLGAGRPHAIVGGFHLCWPTGRDVVEATVDELAGMGPDVVVPCHCTGREAMDLIARRMPGAFVMATVGARIAF